MRKIALCFLLILTAIASLAVADGFSFVVYGDNRPAKAELAQPETFLKIINEINKLKGPEFAVSLGDMVYDSRDPVTQEKRFDEYLACIAPLRIPVYHVPGNHDIAGRRENEELFKKKFGPLYTSFMTHGCLFICLNSEELGRDGTISETQMVWLEKELRKSAKKKFIFVHRPFFPNYYRQDNLAYSMKMWNLFKKNHVSAVFCGHEHFFNETVLDGIPQYTSGGAGAPLYPSANGRFYHFCVVNVWEKGFSVTPVRIND